MSNPSIQNINGENYQNKKDVIDEAIERIQEKLKIMRGQNKSLESDTERKRRFQERIKTFSSMNSNLEGPAKDIQGQAKITSCHVDKCTSIKQTGSTIWDKEFY